jgi:hypothetical protein
MFNSRFTSVKRFRPLRRVKMISTLQRSPTRERTALMVWHWPLEISQTGIIAPVYSMPNVTEAQKDASLWWSFGSLYSSGIDSIPWRRLCCQLKGPPRAARKTELALRDQENGPVA